MEKKQQNRGGGIVFYIILAAIIGIIIFSVRSFNKKVMIILIHNLYRTLMTVLYPV